MNADPATVPPAAEVPGAKTPVAAAPAGDAAATAAPVEPRAEDIADALRQRFPALFAGAPKPIKLRIQADIRERAPGEFSKAALSAFLRRHTGRTSYLIALTRATHRFDLDGAPADELSAEHRQAASDELARRRALRETREAQAESERRARAELLRSFQTTSLNAANFCALKGIAPEQLEGLLALARSEAEERSRAAAAPRPGPRGRPAQRRG